MKPAPTSAPQMRAESCVVQRSHQMLRRQGGADQGAAHADVRRPHHPGQRRHAQHHGGVQLADEGEHQDDAGHAGIGHTQGGQHPAQAQPVPQHAHHGRHQGAHVHQRAEQRQQHHRARFHQHVPPQDQRLHLHGPGREEIGRPQEPEAARAKRRQSRGGAQRRTCRREVGAGGCMGAGIRGQRRAVSACRSAALPSFAIRDPSPADGLRPKRCCDALML